MIRVIVRTVGYGRSVHVGGPVSEDFKTFDIEAPELEGYLRKENAIQYVEAQAIGVELLEPPK